MTQATFYATLFKWFTVPYLNCIALLEVEREGKATISSDSITNSRHTAIATTSITFTGVPVKFHSIIYKGRHMTSEIDFTLWLQNLGNMSWLKSLDSTPFLGSATFNNQLQEIFGVALVPIQLSVSFLVSFCSQFEGQLPGRKYKFTYVVPPALRYSFVTSNFTLLPSSWLRNTRLWLLHIEYLFCYLSVLWEILGACFVSREHGT